ncbi:SHOCT domain-containing protein [Conyzicola sp.]|uniref:SHOCT domain-containing protein n=1 Tax=Conyzicola sp. TaxID=1969404 RepID=UPI00398A3A32
MPLFRRFGRPGLLGLAARTAVVAGTAGAVSGGMARHQRDRANEQAEQEQYAAQQQQAQIDAAANAAVQNSAAAAPDLTGELERLAALHSQGVLSDGEFAVAKTKLLS